MTDREVMQPTCIGKDPRCPCQDGDACHYKDCGNTKAWPVPQAEPSQWRDMVVVSLVREGIDKHKARELADHFAAQQQAEPVAWMSQAGNFLSLLEFTRADAELYGWKPVYTAPPQRKELSESEILDMMPSTIPAEYDGPLMKFARDLEAKLKERNT